VARTLDALLNARLRRGGVADRQFHDAKDDFSTTEDAVAVTHNDCWWVKTMVSCSVVSVTTAMPLPDTSGERGQAASP